MAISLLASMHTFRVQEIKFEPSALVLLTKQVTLVPQPVMAVRFRRLSVAMASPLCL